jgi:hypothetical protein
MSIALMRNFKDGTAGSLFVIRAEAACIGAVTRFYGRRRISGQHGSEATPNIVGPWIIFPYQNIFQLPVHGAALLQINLIVDGHSMGRNAPKTMGAETFCLG